jgi:hypothetical protein
MNKPISTKTHGILDYLTVPTLLVLPHMLGLNKKVSTLLTGTAFGLLSYSMLTRYELGLFKLLPMKGHLAIDMLSGTMLAAAPFALLNKQERTGTVTGILLGFGIFEVTTASLTQKQPSYAGTQDVTVADRLVAGLGKVKETVGIGR